MLAFFKLNAQFCDDFSYFFQMLESVLFLHICATFLATFLLFSPLAILQQIASILHIFCEKVVQN